MNDKLFNELLESIKEGADILKGKKQASRKFNLEYPDVKLIRKSFGLSQTKFSRLLGISPSTLRNWEQGLRRPEGAARVLLSVAARHPEAVLDTVKNMSSL
jgi:putative transcriptional regulator